MEPMERALTLARRALGHTSPNPAVGAVLVKDGRVVGEGGTEPPGGAHAEVTALRQAGELARGATMYVTLEPCCHEGRTPPCTRAILEAGVAEVRFSHLDPDPHVSGTGQDELEAAGVRVVVGEGEREARRINEAYIKHRTTGLPFVIAKFASSLDGKIAAASGDSRWVSGPESRERAHQQRTLIDAILVGVATVLLDDPQLTARPGDRLAERQPLRVVADSRGRTPPSARVLQADPPALIATTEGSPPGWRQEIAAAGAEVAVLPADDNRRVDLSALLKLLGERDVLALLIEGGGELLGSFFDRGLVDKVQAVVAPLILGGTSFPAVAGRGVRCMPEALRLHEVQVERLGLDILVTGYARPQDEE
jgi:diaminohydroxyphosphoribosylaminopyrimidine deaminase/5-amino-6-(5-phosphoribosylamino)uracil reductase